MEKLILTDKMEIEIMLGASLGNITAVAQNFQELGTIAEALTTGGNLDAIQFSSDGAVTGEYTHMKPISPLFREVDIRDEKVVATLALREKTSLEKQLDRIESKQQLQDGAIEELGEVVSTLADGGEA